MKENFSTIQETFELPSKGLIYSATINPKVTLRSMTTRDEMIRLSPSEDIFYNLCDLIDNCITSDIGISTYDLCLGDYLYLLYALRTVTYGSSYKINSVCPYCGHTSTHDVDLSTLEVISYDEEKGNEYKQFTLPISKKKITLNFQTPRMMDEINQKQKEFKRKHKDVDNYDLIITLCAVIDTIDGKRFDEVTKEE